MKGSIDIPGRHPDIPMPARSGTREAQEAAEAAERRSAGVTLCRIALSRGESPEAALEALQAAGLAEDPDCAWNPRVGVVGKKTRAVTG